MASRYFYGLLASVAGGLGACAAVPEPAPLPVAPAPAVTAAAPPQTQPIAWTEASDCQAKLRLLEQAARAGRLGPDERPPFAVVLPGASGGRNWLAPPSVAIVADLPLAIHERADAAKISEPCLVLIEPARDQRVGHRVIGRDLVRSLYQNGVRSERNPDYDAAQLRVRQAEREARDDGPDILKVGDPMLDLVGLLIGSVVSGFGQGSREREVDEALSELASTPRSRDRPLYRAYEFERITVLAGKEAIVPVALLDRASGRVWRAELRRREQREIAILDGLDPRDRDYDTHSAATMTRHDFERWQREPPQLQLAAIATALREAAAAPARDAGAVATLAAQPTAGPTSWEGERLEPLAPLRASVLPPAGERAAARRRARAERAAIDASWPLAPEDQVGDEALSRLLDEDRRGEGRDLDAAMTLRPEDPARAPAGLGRQALRTGVPSAGDGDGALPNEPGTAPGDPRAASIVRLTAGARSGSGVYIRPDLVLTTAQLVERTSVVDVVTFDGARVLGLVARADPVRDLALVQVARPGPPVAIYDGPPLAAGRPVEAIALSRSGGATLTPGRYQGAGSPPGLTGPGFADLVHVEAPTAPADPLAMPWFVGDAVIGMVGGAALDRSDGSLGTVRASEIIDFLYGSGGALAALR